MRGLIITQESLENQRQAVKEERRLRGDNQAYGNVSEKLDELVYDNFVYHHSVIGSMEDLDAATVRDVKEFSAFTTRRTTPCWRWWAISIHTRRWLR
jgi:predicted Zn-dependent peptidase